LATLPILVSSRAARDRHTGHAHAQASTRSAGLSTRETV
jgi:hypothetical protein